MSGKLRTSIIWLGVGVNLLNISFVSFGLLLFVLTGQAINTLDINSLGPIFLSFSISIVSALIIAKQPENPMGWIYSAVGFFQGLSWFSTTYAIYALITRPGSLPGGGVMSVLSGFAWAPGLSILLTYAVLLYPTGRLLTRRWRVVAWASLVPPLFALLAIFLTLPYGGKAVLEGQATPPNWLGISSNWFVTGFNLMFPWMLVCGIASLVSITLRFLRSSSVERQQIKWFAFSSILVIAILFSADWSSTPLKPVWLVWILALMAGLSIPAATAIAILRYHLWDIDVIIRRTLVYGGLTAILLLIYFGSVLLLQNLLQALTGQSRSPVVIVISTLTIAALFNPLRKRIQDNIDRRFYRRKYDAEQTLEAFTAGLRQEVDLDEINRSLLAVTMEALQPENASLWLRDSGEVKR
jgi:hypothetical protein